MSPKKLLEPPLMETYPVNQPTRSEVLALTHSPTRVFTLNLDADDGFIDDDEALSESSLSCDDDDNANVQFTYTTSTTPDQEFNEANYNDGLEDETAFMFFSPNGTKTWLPKCESNIKPVEGMTFNHLDDALQFYRAYAEACGFTVRINQGKKSGNVTKSKYYRCNRAGKPQSTKTYSKNTKIRQTSFKTIDCKAHIYVSMAKGASEYTVTSFQEFHNHALVEDFNKDLSKIARKLPFATKEFIHKMSLNSIGPVKAHRMLVSIMGGHHKVKGTPSDFKNFSKTTRMFIGTKDSQLLLNKLLERSRIMKDFYFDYEVSDGKLKCLFWADEISKLNYRAFGDVLAFDATYHTNKYNLIFVPFTGVDSHKQAVTFGAGLLFNETIESYQWLLEQFLLAHDSKQPTLVLTDQDPAMRKAIKKTFTQTKHRLCMWHIMKKLPAKITGDILDNTDFRCRLHRLVWSVYMKTTTFETRWNELIAEFDLMDHRWLKKMFKKRKKWVPAFFREIPMCCLLKTTSICESSNASFKINSSGANTLIQFMLCFETRIESQRYRQRCADFKTSTLTYFSEEDIPIESHAFDVYTNRIFREVKREIRQGWYNSYISNTETSGDNFLYSVSQRRASDGVVNTFKVTYDTVEHTADCSCMSFTRIGYLCSHVFCVFRVWQINKIPDCYISNRWTRDILPRSVYSIDSRYGIDKRPETVLKQDILGMVTDCLEVLRLDIDGLQLMSEKMKQLKLNILHSNSENHPTNASNIAVTEDILGHAVDVEVDVDNPEGVRTKGCGKKRRQQAPVEFDDSRPVRVGRKCKICQQVVIGHDSRNCPMKDTI